MKIRHVVIVGLAALLLGGCATYGYRGGSGDYYYDRSFIVYYGAPYGSVGYGRMYGVYGNVGYGYPGYSRHYAPRYYGYPSYGYYSPPYYGRPIVVRPRPDHNRPPRQDNRPSSPWRNLKGVTRVEHRERPQRIGGGNTAGPRPQSQRRERVQQSNPVRRPANQPSRSSPWRAGQSQQRSSQPSRVRATPAAPRQSAAPVR